MEKLNGLGTGQNLILHVLRWACDQRKRQLFNLFEEENRQIRSVGFASDREEVVTEMEDWKKTNFFYLNELEEIERFLGFLEGVEDIVLLEFPDRKEVWILKKEEDEPVLGSPHVLQLAVAKLGDGETPLEIIPIPSDCPARRQYEDRRKEKGIKDGENIRILDEEARLFII